MKEQKIFEQLEEFYSDSFEITVTNEDRIVIFSDLHMGNGSDRDEFVNNSKLFKFILCNYYKPMGFSLVLNGDVEELYKFSIKPIYDSWKDVYSIYSDFESDNRFYKLIGNHDHDLIIKGFPGLNKNLFLSLKLNYSGNRIFIFHGHQASGFIESYNKFAMYFVRYLLNPLKIKNLVYPLTSKKRFLTEVSSYRFSKQHKIMSILGHTHRPLFESMSKLDYLTVRIENLIRKYPKADSEDKVTFAGLIEKYKTEIFGIENRDGAEDRRFGLYNGNLLVPCLFNSGSVIGKHGITGIEIKKGKIFLVYWFDKNLSHRYLEYKGENSKQFEGTDYYWALLNSENLDYVFTRIKLLS